MKQASGRDVYAQKDIIECFRKHLQRVYRSPQPPSEDSIIAFLHLLQLPNVDAEVRQELDADIKQKEIAKALRMLPLDKALGIDGFPTEFYKEYTPLVSQLLLKLYNEIGRAHV